MSKTEKIMNLTRNKDRRVTLVVNRELWDLFLQACGEDKTKPTPKIEKWVLDYIDEKGLL